MNKFELCFGRDIQMPNMAFRVDIATTAHLTTKSLRSGRSLDMCQYNGTIHRSNIINLQNVEIRVILFSNHFRKSIQRPAVLVDNYL